MPKMLNPDKAKVGCTVPLCYGVGCNEDFKAKCALRKYHLMHLAELILLLTKAYTDEAKEPIKRQLEWIKKAKETSR